MSLAERWAEFRKKCEYHNQTKGHCEHSEGVICCPTVRDLEIMSLEERCPLCVGNEEMLRGMGYVPTNKGA